MLSRPEEATLTDNHSDATLDSSSVNSCRNTHIFAQINAFVSEHDENGSSGALYFETTDKVFDKPCHHWLLSVLLRCGETHNKFQDKLFERSQIMLSVEARTHRLKHTSTSAIFPAQEQ